MANIEADYRNPIVSNIIDMSRIWREPIDDFVERIHPINRMLLFAQCHLWGERSDMETTFLSAFKDGLPKHQKEQLLDSLRPKTESYHVKLEAFEFLSGVASEMIGKASQENKLDSLGIPDLMAEIQRREAECFQLSEKLEVFPALAAIPGQDQGYDEAIKEYGLYPTVYELIGIDSWPKGKKNKLLRFVPPAPPEREWSVSPPTNFSR